MADLSLEPTPRLTVRGKAVQEKVTMSGRPIQQEKSISLANSGA